MKSKNIAIRCIQMLSCTIQPPLLLRSPRCCINSSTFTSVSPICAAVTWRCRCCRSDAAVPYHGGRFFSAVGAFWLLPLSPLSLTHFFMMSVYIYICKSIYTILEEEGSILCCSFCFIGYFDDDDDVESVI